MLWLRNLTNVPQGEFYYREGGKTFGPGPLANEIAAALGSFRSANKLPRADYVSCMVDLVSFTATRLGPDAEWVYQTDKSPESLVPSQGGGCGGCGAALV